MAGKNVVREDVVKISFDVAKSPFADIDKQSKSLTSGLGKSISDVDGSTSKLKNGLKAVGSVAGKTFAAVGKGLMVGAGVTAAGITAITKQAIDNYAEYEQLVGGVDTLFGKSSKKVQEYASNAYKTAGLSANEYMSTVTSFSASLLQSLGGDTNKAASVADMAITDMADNANKMGLKKAHVKPIEMLETPYSSINYNAA
ncbi:MAG: hypothetical protein IKK84_00205 [Clostridia bacterium]|nr:hypothetical protein [Clostridia bacterium]